MNYKIVMAIIAIVIVIGTAFAYVYLSSAQATVSLKGAGATFPAPLLSAMISQYQQDKTNVQINYQALGSGYGISALESKTVDFAASDAPLNANDMAQANNSLHIPETIGAVTLAYNIPNISTGLNLTGKVIADIFLGNVTVWNDPEIQNLNTLTLPAKSIITIHRSDSSGTTFIFTGYLSASSPAWQQKIGQSKSINWPNPPPPATAIGANGNSGVASVVQGTNYTIGYVELAYALSNNMAVAAVKNPAGNWILPSLTTIQQAVQSAASSGLPAGNQSWASVNLLNAPDQLAYPIVSFTYLLVYQELNIVPGMTEAKATALVKFLWWVVHDGQLISNSQWYVQLPANVVTTDENSIRSITFNGQHPPTN